jgi:hypothetical protein
LEVHRPSCHDVGCQETRIVVEYGQVWVVCQPNSETCSQCYLFTHASCCRFEWFWILGLEWRRPRRRVVGRIVRAVC